MVIIKVKTVRKVAESIIEWVVRLSKGGKNLILGMDNETNTIYAVRDLYDTNRHAYDINTIPFA